MNNQRLKFISFSLPVIIFLVLFFYWPIYGIINLALSSDITSWTKILSSPLFHKFLGFTIAQAILTVLGSLIIGVPTGYLLSRGNPYFGGLIRSAITVPFLFPPLALLLGFITLFGSYGIFNEIFQGIIEFDPYTFWGIVILHVSYNISVIARISESAFNNENSELHNIAISLGASRWLRLKSITYPHIKSSIESGMMLVFLYAFNSFAIVLVLGEVRLQTIEVMIYAQSLLRLNYSASSILVVIQVIINIFVIWLYSKRTSNVVPDDEIVNFNPTINRKLSTTVLLLVILITWIPVFILLSRTITGIIEAPQIFKDQLFSGSFDRFLGTSSLRVILNTLFIGIIVSTISILLSSLMIASTQFLKDKKRGEKLFLPLILLPMGTSAISLSFGILMTHGKFEIFSGIVWIYIITAHALAALPFASRTMFSSWNHIPEDLFAISQTLGADFKMTLEHVILPFMKSAILISIVFSFAISIGEFGATFYLARGEWVTLSLAIHRMFGGRNIILPYLYASILIISSLILFAIIEKFGSLEMKL